MLIERAQLKAQQHRVTYDSPIDTLSIVKDLCNLKQLTTQSGGLRPFGVSLLIAGIDGNKPSLFETDPTGIFFQYKAAAIGEGETEVEEILAKEYRDDITVEEALKLAVKALSTILEDLNIDRLDCVYLLTSKKLYKRVPADKLAKILGDVKPDSKKKK